MARKPTTAAKLEALGDYVAETADSLREIIDILRDHVAPNVQCVFADVERRLGQANRDYESGFADHT